MRYAYSQYSDLATGLLLHACMHTWQMYVLSVTVMLYTVWGNKETKDFQRWCSRHERATERTFISRVGYSPGRYNSS